MILSSSSVAHGCTGTPQPHAGTPQQHAPVAATPEPTIPEALLPAPGPLSNTRLLAQASQPAGVVSATIRTMQRRLLDAVLVLAVVHQYPGSYVR